VIQRLCDAVAIQSAKWAYITPLMVLVWGRLRRMSRRFPSSPGWLLHYVQLEAAATANLLRHMLEHDPEMRALLEAAPQLGRILRPLLRMVSAAPLPARLVRPSRPPPGAVPVSPASQPPASRPSPTATPAAAPEPPGLSPKPA
jgi:hypothetical protein